jgi:hypothetical protein
MRSCFALFQSEMHPEDLVRMAANINEAIFSSETLTGQLIRVYRSGPPSIS